MAREKEFDLDAAIAETVRKFTAGDCFLLASKVKASKGLVCKRFFTGEDAAEGLRASRVGLSVGRVEWSGVWIVPADKRDGVADQFEHKNEIPVEGLVAFASRAIGADSVDHYRAFNRLFPFDARDLATGPLIATKKGKESWEFLRVGHNKTTEALETMKAIHRGESFGEIIVAAGPDGERVRGMIADGQIERARDVSIYWGTTPDPRGKALAMYQGGEQ